MTERLKYLGRSVKSQFNERVGIVVAVAEGHINGAYVCRVRYWFEETQNYSERLMMSPFLRFADDLEDIEKNDSRFWKFYQVALLDAALISNDVDWFEEAKGMNGYVKYI